MKQKGCFYCEKAQELKSVLIEVCDLQVSTVFFSREQTYKGRCSVAFRDHHKELFELTPSELAEYMQDVTSVAGILHRLYHPDKINYAIFGDIINHVHFNLVPKYKDAPRWGEPFDNNPAEKHYMTPEETISRVTEFLDALKQTGRITKTIYLPGQS